MLSTFKTEERMSSVSPFTSNCIGFLIGLEYGNAEKAERSTVLHQASMGKEWKFCRNGCYMGFALTVISSLGAYFLRSQVCLGVVVLSVGATCYYGNKLLEVMKRVMNAADEHSKDEAAWKELKNTMENSPFVKPRG